MKVNNLQEWRARVIARDQFICRRCGAENSFVAHHIKAQYQEPKLALELDNGETLCQVCHRKLPRGNSHQRRVISISLTEAQEWKLTMLRKQTGISKSGLVQRALMFLFTERAENWNTPNGLDIDYVIKELESDYKDNSRKV